MRRAPIRSADDRHGACHALGHGLGTAGHLVAGLFFAPILGAFHTMVSGSLIGMYGGMLFAMRETMQHPTSLNHAAGIGVLFGVVVVAAVQLYDRALRVGQSAEE